MFGGCFGSPLKSQHSTRGRQQRCRSAANPKPLGEVRAEPALLQGIILDTKSFHVPKQKSSHSWLQGPVVSSRNATGFSRLSAHRDSKPSPTVSCTHTEPRQRLLPIGLYWERYRSLVQALCVGVPEQLPNGPKGRWEVGSSSQQPSRPPGTASERNSLLLLKPPSEGSGL